MAEYIDQAIIDYALKQTSIKEIVDDRLYHIKAPQDTKRPYGVLNLVTGSGMSEEFTVTRMGQPYFQFTCVSYADLDKTPCDAYLLAQALLDIFVNYQGDLEGVTVKIMWGNFARQFLSSSTEDIICIAELNPHYIEP